MVACLWLVTLLLWLGLYRAKPPFVFVCAVLSTLLFWLLATPAFSNFAVGKLENLRTNPAICHSAPADSPLIVLSGGLDKYVLSDNPYRILSRDSLLRALDVVDRVAESDEPFAIYLSGSVSHRRNPAELMAEVLVRGGVDAGRIVTETNSTSTAQSAVEMASLLPPESVPLIRLLTSASHVFRSAEAFTRQGFTVCHVDGVDTAFSPAVLPVSLLPYLSGLTRSTKVLHELIALLVYKLRGYI